MVIRHYCKYLSPHSVCDVVVIKDLFKTLNKTRHRILNNNNNNNKRKLSSDRYWNAANQIWQVDVMALFVISKPTKKGIKIVKLRKTKLV